MGDYSRGTTRGGGEMSWHAGDHELWRGREGFRPGKWMPPVVTHRSPLAKAHSKDRDIARTTMSASEADWRDRTHRSVASVQESGNKREVGIIIIICLEAAPGRPRPAPAPRPGFGVPLPFSFYLVLITVLISYSTLCQWEWQCAPCTIR